MKRGLDMLRIFAIATTVVCVCGMRLFLTNYKFTQPPSKFKINPQQKVNLHSIYFSELVGETDLPADAGGGSGVPVVDFRTIIKQVVEGKVDRYSFPYLLIQG